MPSCSLHHTTPVFQIITGGNDISLTESDWRVDWSTDLFNSFRAICTEVRDVADVQKRNTTGELME